MSNTFDGFEVRIRPESDPSILPANLIKIRYRTGDLSPYSIFVAASLPASRTGDSQSYKPGRLGRFAEPMKAETIYSERFFFSFRNHDR